jgi:hypothetical protein
MTRLWTGILGLVAFVALGCGTDAPPGARVVKTMTLTSPVALLDDVQLLRTGADFVLAGYEEGMVRWAHVSEAGDVSAESAFTLSTPILGPYFAATKKATPGDQLIAVVVNRGAGGGYELQAFVHNPGDPQAAGPVVISTLPGGVTPEIIKVSAGVASTGNVGLVTWGFQGQGIAPTYRFLGQDAALLGEVGKIGDAVLASEVAKWDCLRILQAATPLGIALAYPISQLDNTLLSGSYVFERFELNESALVSDTPMFLQDAVKSCQITGAPSSDGYVMAWKNEGGIFAGRLYNPVGSSVEGTVITHMILATTQFSTPKDIPSVSFVAPAGSDTVVGLSRESGPLLARFDFDGAAHGSDLILPSTTGKTGPMTGWVGPSQTFVTYSDVAKTAPFGPTKRYFLQVEFPASL